MIDCENYYNGKCICELTILIRMKNKGNCLYDSCPIKIQNEIIKDCYLRRIISQIKEKDKKLKKELNNKF